MKKTKRRGGGLAVIDEKVLLHDGSEDVELQHYQSQQTETYKDVILGDNLNDVQRAQIKNLLLEFEQIFSDVPGRTNLLEVEIKVKPGHEIKAKTYPIPFALRDDASKECESMLKQQLIERSFAETTSPLIMIRKPDMSFRLVTDFRAVNKIIQNDLEPIPQVDEIWNKVQGSQWYSKFDLTKGFYQLPLKESSRDITSFQSPLGLMRYCVLPFGIQIAPSAFSRAMRMLLKGSQNLEHFFDDVLAHTSSWEDHLLALRDFFSRVRAANLTLRPTKCQIGLPQVNYVGFTMSREGILPIKAKVAEILDVPRPRTKKQLQSFIGMIQFYRRFVPNFSSIAVALTDLTKKKEPNTLVWGPMQNEAFLLLKQKLAEGPILIWPDLNKDFFVQSDASGLGLGAVLLQEVDGLKHPVCYASRKLLPRETRYSTIERELLAIVWGIQKFQLYLYGKRFFLETDHQPLTYLYTSQPQNHRLLRWALILQQYDVTVLSIKGSDNHLADFLSRCPRD